MSIAEKRIPQDGRIQMNIGGRALDFRVSCLPTTHGESIVMRILDKEGIKLGLAELGFLTDDQQIFERLISMPDGILLVTGPTGSGKTTTLYACLNYINHPDRKIITVEDPVEYVLSGINQVHVNEMVGLTFSAALRAILRQAPNIIMVGEIRDLETASIAINASLTGHLVFSTLHTNDAPSAVTRLIDIGVKPFLIATSARAFMAQRLVRKICKKCGQPVPLTEAEMRPLGIQSENVVVDFKEGDTVTVKISARTRGGTDNADNVVITDLLPGGFIPDSQTIAGDMEYAEFRTDRVLIFTDLTRDTREFTYTAQIGSAGEFTVPAISAMSMYNPEISATGRTDTFTATNENAK